MNLKFSAKAIQRGFWMGAMLLSATVASASSSILTFQVDMTDAIAGIGFNPTNQTVAARGTFDGWASPGFALTNNPSGANPNLWSGTFTDTTDGNGLNTSWQFVTVTNGVIDQYSSQNDGDNYVAVLPATSGGSLVIPVEFFSDDGPAVTNALTFQVDMAEQLHLGNFNTGDFVACQGQFEGWSDSFLLTNDTALNVTNGQGVVTSMPYVGTYTTWSEDQNAETEYKFVYNNGSDNYEAPTQGNIDRNNNNNRFLLNQPINGAQVMPLVNFSDASFSASVTNNVTFEIDMTTQIAVSNFTSANTVEIHGDFNSWGNGQTMTNNPGGSTPDIYSTVITYVDAPGAEHYFKYVIQPNTEWENVSAVNASGGNRYLFLAKTSGNFTNGPVYYSDEAPGEIIDFVLVTNCMVTFTVNMTNGTGMGPGGTATFDNAYPSGDSIYLNGLNGGVNDTFWKWGGLGNPTYQMTQIPNTFLFTITVPVNLGQQDYLTYKYSINGYDDEAASGDNRQRWIRSLPNYTMPVDTYGNPTTEIPAGDLTVTAIAGDKVQLSWLGRRGVLLETATSLDPGTVWTPVPLSDGTNLIVAPGGMATTNYTIGQTNVFYQLIGPLPPDQR